MSSNLMLQFSVNSSTPVYTQNGDLLGISVTTDACLIGLSSGGNMLSANYVDPSVGMTASFTPYSGTLSLAAYVVPGEFRVEYTISG